jgi:excisionase family DNA binding protein
MPHPVKTQKTSQEKQKETLERFRSKDSDVLLTYRDVCKITKLHRITIHRLVLKREFPPPRPSFKGSREVKFLASEVDAWIKALPLVPYAPKKMVAK